MKKRIKRLQALIFLHRRQTGFSLIEVMVTSLIISFALLALARAQLISLQKSQQSYLLSLTDLKRVELAERFRSCGMTQSVCIQQELKVWKREVQEDFPQARAEISKKQENCYQSQIHWATLPESALLVSYLLFCL